MLFYDFLKDIFEAKSRLAKSTQSKEKTDRENGGMKRGDQECLSVIGLLADQRMHKAAIVLKKKKKYSQHV